MIVRAVVRLAALCIVLVSAPHALGNGDILFLDCPCRLQSDGTTLTITVGARSFRGTDSGSVRVRVLALEEDGSWSHTVVGEARIADSIGAGARLASVSVDTSFESRPTGLGGIQLLLEEQVGESWRHQDGLWMESRVDLTKPFDIRDLDYLEDSDGDGVADENERLAGTDPVDAASTPGATTVDVLAFYTRGYADLYGGVPVARISHLFASSNAMLEDSGVSLRLRVVGAVEVELANEREWFSQVDQETLLSEGDRHGADLPALFTIQPPNVPAGYGCSFAYRSRGHIDRDTAKLHSDL